MRGRNFPRSRGPFGGNVTLTTRRTDFFDDSWSSPAMISSSKTEYAFWKLKILDPACGLRTVRTSAGGETTRTYKSSSHTCERKFGVWARIGIMGRRRRRTHVPEIPIQDFDITMDDLQRREFVIPRRDPTHEEKGGVSPVDDLGIYNEKERNVSTMKILSMQNVESDIKPQRPTYPCTPRNYTSSSALQARAG